MTLGDVIKKYRKDNGLSMADFAKMSGISKAYIALLEKNRHPKTGKPIVPSITIIKQAADAMHMDFNKFFEKIDGDVSIDDKQPDDRPIARRIPVLGRVAAGVPLEAITDIDDWEEIPEKLAETDEYFALTIHGDSMEPKMNEGDVVIVRRQPDVESGDIAIVRVNGYDATCKKVVKQDGGILLVGLNPSFTPIFYSKEDIESLPVQIDGKVVELRAKF